MDAEALEKLVVMKMPFGKHAGRALADLPGNYLAWFAREGFPKGELGQLLELMHTLDHNGCVDYWRLFSGRMAFLFALANNRQLLRAHDYSNAIAFVAHCRRIWWTALREGGFYHALRLNFLE